MILEFCKQIHIKISKSFCRTVIAKFCDLDLKFASFMKGFFLFEKERSITFGFIVFYFGIFHLYPFL